MRRLVYLGHSKQGGVGGVIGVQIREVVGFHIPQGMWT